jgi:hypothetical protein
MLDYRYGGMAHGRHEVLGVRFKRLWVLIKKESGTTRLFFNEREIEIVRFRFDIPV